MTRALISIATLCLLIFTGCGFVVHETYTEASDSTNGDVDRAEQTHFVITASGFSAGSTYTINGTVDSDSDEDYFYLEVYDMPTVQFGFSEDGVVQTSYSVSLEQYDADGFEIMHQWIPVHDNNPFEAWDEAVVWAICVYANASTGFGSGTEYSLTLTQQ